MRPLAVPTGPRVAQVLPALEAALRGGAPVAPYGPAEPAPHLPEPDRLPDGLALCVGTSGSTGRVKRAMLTRDNLLASARSTHEVLGGDGTWLLAMPAHHVAGLQVLVRSLVAGTTPGVLDLGGGFTAAGFVAATAALTGAGRRYTAVVPTQLTRLLEDPAGAAALASYDGVLVGGAATPPAVVRAAAAVGVRLVRTYGGSETAGGCVYDGLPLPVSEVHIDNDGHVVLGGVTVAHGYLGEPALTADAFAVDADGTRWFRTDDLGRLDDEGRLEIVGRADDVINTGGLKVTPGTVEDAVSRFVPGVRDVVVVGTPHRTWGEAVSAVVTLQRGAPTPSLRDVRTALRGVVPDHALPQRLLLLDALPLRGPGKPDRRALVQVFADQDEADETLVARRTDAGPG
ncbi:o-succinylbenzoate--CoA ligase [Lapillicoccus jejuensis]